MIICVKGIGINYVIRQNDMTDLSNQPNWEKSSRLADPHAENIYRLDALAIHDVILRKIAESSDAYTYVKTNIRLDNGRGDGTDQG